MADVESFDQHVVSKVLLKRWTESGVLLVYDLRYDSTRLRSPGAEGYITGFMSVGATVLEAKWSAIEQRMPPVFASSKPPWYTVVPIAVPPETCRKLPATLLETRAPLMVPPADTVAEPPPVIEVALAVPPEETYKTPPFCTDVLMTRPAANTVSAAKR